MLAGGGWLLDLVGRQLWPRITGRWGRPKDGGETSGGRASYLLLVALPALVAWCAGLAVIATSARLRHPRLSETPMRIMAGNSIVNVTQGYPGGAGVNQASTLPR